eukprot:1933016-Amphidinium_carterae.1
MLEVLWYAQVNLHGATRTGNYQFTATEVLWRSLATQKCVPRHTVYVLLPSSAHHHDMHDICCQLGLVSECDHELHCCGMMPCSISCNHTRETRVINIVQLRFPRDWKPASPLQSHPQQTVATEMITIAIPPKKK